MTLMLTDKQRRLVRTATRAVPPAKRDEFMQKVSQHLTDNPSDHAVSAVVNHQLNLLLHVYMTDAATVEEDMIE